MTPPLGSKESTLKQLQHVKKVSGKTPLQLEQYEKSSIPPSLMYVYKYYLDFYNGSVFSYSELMAWQHYVGIEITYRELELIRQICLERHAYDCERQRAQFEYDKQIALNKTRRGK